MGNCQAIDIDNASLVIIQHPNGKIENLYTSVSAKEIMKINPGHYVALLLTTTLYSSSAKNSTGNNNKIPLRITRIKLLRPTDTLVLGHVYRLVTTKEVMKGVWAKKQARMKQKQNPDYYVEKYGNITEKEISDYEAIIRKNEFQKTNQVKNEIRHRRRNNTHAHAAAAAASKSKAWQPSLKSISEAGS